MPPIPAKFIVVYLTNDIISHLKEFLTDQGAQRTTGQ